MVLIQSTYKTYMRTTCFIVSLCVLNLLTHGQTIKRLDGSVISADSLTSRIQHLMDVANVSGVAISVFNDNQPVYSKPFGYADLPKKITLSPSSEMYGASLSKMVFAYIV